jgi:mono/diheme cytochrome c family protein
MRLCLVCVFTVTMLLGLSSPVTAQSDEQNGAELALDWCARCHNVEPGGPFKLYPPSFASIAVYRSVEHIRAQIAYPPLHTNMPRLSHILTPSNVDNLIAYILSLEEDIRSQSR